MAGHVHLKAGTKKRGGSATAASIVASLGLVGETGGSWPCPPTLPALGDADTNRRTLERFLGAGELHPLAALTEPRLGTLPGRFGPLDVDLLDSLGGIRQHEHAIAVDLQEAAKDDERLLVAALLHPHLTGGEQREQRRVLRQDPKLAIRSRRDDHVDILRLVDHTLASHDLDAELV